MITPPILAGVALCIAVSAMALAPRPGAAQNEPLSLTLRRLLPVPGEIGQWTVRQSRVRWAPDETAAVVCDMWDRHWCISAEARVAEMAPAMNRLLVELRRRGVLIIHSPSQTMEFYKDHPGRLMALAAPKVETASPLQWANLDPQVEPPLPIDDTDGGCDDVPPCPQGAPWRRQIAAVEIRDGDAIADGPEAYYLMRQRGIRNVLIMGVHENMCVLGRPFGIRNLVRLGLNVALVRDMTDTMYNPRRKPGVDHFTANDLVAWHIEKYWCPTLTSDQIVGGRPFRFAADRAPRRVFRNYVTLPKNDAHWQPVASYVEETPHPDYKQAPESAREAFRDLKYGVRIHWGVYSMLGVDASWPFLKMTNEQKQSYQELYRRFNPVDFDADEWMSFFRRNGMNVCAFTSKHHDGFSMFDTRTRVRRRVHWTAPGGPRLEECDLAYSIMETPFHRDIVRELSEAAKRHGVKLDLYFSHPDWYDADFRPFVDHPAAHCAGIPPRVDPVAHPDQWRHFVERHREQLKEVVTRYNPDLVCLDMWFDETAWPDLRETIKQIRKLRPNVMLRARGIGNYGDYYTPEGFVPGAKENTSMPWMVIYQLAGQWSYQPDPSRYHDGAWIVRNLVDCVAKGGAFMVGIGPDERGRFHPKAIEAIEVAGAWLRRNGEAIYGTRPRPGDLWKEGDSVRFTRSKDNRVLYAIASALPGDTLRLATVKPRPDATVRLLGEPGTLSWHADADGALVIELPARLLSALQQPDQLPYAFRIDGGSR